MTDFLQWMCEQIKRVRTDLVTSLFAMPKDSGGLLDRLASLESLDYLGVDGPICDQERAPGKPICKKSLFESAPLLFELCARTGKKSLLVLESFGVPQRAYESYRRALVEAMRFKPDQWIFFYYPHNTEDPERLMAITREAISNLK